MSGTDRFAILRLVSHIRWRAERADRAGDGATASLFAECAAIIETLDRRVRALESILRLEEVFDRAISKQ